MLLRAGCQKEAHGLGGPVQKEAAKRRRTGARCCALAAKRRRAGERARPKRRRPKKAHVLVWTGPAVYTGTCRGRGGSYISSGAC